MPGSDDFFKTLRELGALGAVGLWLFFMLTDRLFTQKYVQELRDALKDALGMGKASTTVVDRLATALEEQNKLREKELVVRQEEAESHRRELEVKDRELDLREKELRRGR